MAADDEEIALRRRLHNDPHFAQLVHAIASLIEDGSFTSADIRRAVTLADELATERLRREQRWENAPRPRGPREAGV
jgi:Arc/MetJ-type ribon-helix-helix transcriptional regulator